MRDVSSPVRVLSAALLALTVVGGVSGCKWFRKDNALYAGPPENRPLEVPPDLDRPRTEGAVSLPQSGQPVTRSGAEAAAQANANGFAAEGAREAVFERVARALVLVSGLSIVNQAELLGTFEVEYGGESFMVRVAGTEGGSFVSAVDARGEPANGAAAQRLMTALKGAVAQ